MSCEVAYTNDDTFLTLDQLGIKPAPYSPTYLFSGPFINENHAIYANCPTSGAKIEIGIKGSLRREDALKLYELAYFSSGDILELGCNHGLSTSILSQANHDAGLKNKIHTNDLETRYIDKARSSLVARSLENNVEFHAGDAVKVCREFVAEGRQFSFAFVDHSHAYECVFDVSKELKALISSDGFVLFHDFNDRRNSSTTHEAYGVAQAVIDAFRDSQFRFYGLFGCAALYRG